MVSGGGGSSESTTVDVLPKEFKELRGPFADVLRQFFPALAQLGTESVGQQTQQAAALGPGLTAPVTGQQTDLINQIVQAAGVANPLVNAASQTLQGFMGGSQNPFIDAVVQAAQGDLARNFEDVIVPQLLSRSTLHGQEVQGQGSSAFAREARLAGSEQQRLLADTSSRIRAGAFETEQGRKLEAAAQATNLSNEQVNRLMTGLQAASLPQLTQDLGIQRGLEAFQTRTAALLAALQTLAGVTAPATGQNSNSSQFQFGIGF